MPKRISLKGRGADIFFGDGLSSGSPLATSPLQAENPSPSPVPDSDTIVNLEQPADTPSPETEISVQPEQAAVIPDPDQNPEPTDVSLDACMQESKHASKQASMEESKLADVSLFPQTKRSRKRPNVALSAPETNLSGVDMRPSPVEILNGVWQNINDRGMITNAFRYSDEELTLLADILYEVSKKYAAKISKQDIARLGLDALLWDYQQHGEASLLIEFVKRKKDQRK
jgi:hypothetical protein